MSNSRLSRRQQKNRVVLFYIIAGDLIASDAVFLVKNYHKSTPYLCVWIPYFQLSHCKLINWNHDAIEDKDVTIVRLLGVKNLITSWQTVTNRYRIRFKRIGIVSLIKTKRNYYVIFLLQSTTVYCEIFLMAMYVWKW